MSGFQNLQLGSHLGSGHFGEVFRGTDNIHGEVAVKVLRQESGESDSDWQQRKVGLLEEGQKLAAATHVNVVRVFRVVESDSGDAVHLVMECCAGGSLQKQFDIGPMRVSDLRKVATDIALGLQALHTRDMLHRDIKPGNLLLDSHGTAKLGDFGLVTDNIILGYASAQGYRDHVAYEVWGGSGTSIKTDIWAFGMTIYRLLHGKDWYSRSIKPEVIIRDGKFVDTLLWLPHIPAKWRRFIRKTMQDSPAARHQNVTQIVGALARLPVEPAWDCSISSSEIKWQRSAAGRHIVVTWTQHSPRSHSWKAWSEPIGKGKRRSLGGSTKKLGGVQVERELTRFFAKQT
jgi:eukaryotic-like serine/threonine-protein kinase